MNTATNFQLNPHAIKLCALGRWLSEQQLTPTTSGLLSYRQHPQRALVSSPDKDKGQLSPQDLIEVPLDEPSGLASAGLGALHPDVALHQALYQKGSHVQVILQTHSVNALVFADVIQAKQYRFTGYALAQTKTAASASALVGATPSWEVPIIEDCHFADVVLQQLDVSTVPTAFLIRGRGLVVAAESIEQAKQQVARLELLFAVTLERFKITGLPSTQPS